ncbi:MAG: N-acetylmuramidase family protein [Pikeienuella sp.]
MDFVGTGKRLDDIDLPRLGSDILVGEDEVHAVLDVECRGRGFDSNNRPAMLFETHKFYKFCPKKYRGEAVRLGLATRKWTRNYQKDSYPRLQKAAAYDLEAACLSASWGLGQIMGFNHKLAGYRSAVEMVEAFKTGEAEQLRGMINFIKSTGLDKALRAHDWRAFAKGYNGPGYAKHGYHTRLEAAYIKWSAIPDTDWKRTMAVATAHTKPIPATSKPGLVDAILEIIRSIFGGRNG